VLRVAPIRRRHRYDGPGGALTHVCDDTAYPAAAMPEECTCGGEPMTDPTAAERFDHADTYVEKDSPLWRFAETFAHGLED
jgi:hypothetical protein